MTRVVIVDDQTLVRQGIRSLLSVAGIDVIAEDGRASVELIQSASEFCDCDRVADESLAPPCNRIADAEHIFLGHPSIPRLVVSVGSPYSSRDGDVPLCGGEFRHRAVSALIMPR